MIRPISVQKLRSNLYIVRSFPFSRMEKRGKDLIFISLSLVVMLAFGVSATDQTVTVTLEPADSTPIFVGDTFDVKVMLSVPAETVTPNLYSSLIKFQKGSTANFRSPGLLDSDIFNPLEQNGLVFGLWTMDGDSGGTPFTLTSTPQRLGTIPMTALRSGQLDVSFNAKAGSVVFEQSPFIPKVAPPHYYSIAPLVVNVNIRDHQCGDGIESGTESERTCCIDTGCSDLSSICSTTGNPNGQCLADADGDGIPDDEEGESCRGTPSGYAIFASGGLRGCLIGDIDVDGDIDPDDISQFIYVYNHLRDAPGRPPAADLDQDLLLGPDDISEFIFHYNRRP